jgi:hypothetical protein
LVVIWASVSLNWYFLQIWNPCFFVGNFTKMKKHISIKKGIFCHRFPFSKLFFSKFWRK